MDRLSIPLNLLPVGCTARVKEIKAKGNIRRRMLDLGLVTGTEIEAVLRSPSRSCCISYKGRSNRIQVR